MVSVFCLDVYFSFFMHPAVRNCAQALQETTIFGREDINATICIHHFAASTTKIIHFMQILKNRRLAQVANARIVVNVTVLHLWEYEGKYTTYANILAYTYSTKNCSWIANTESV